ncbi:unannotated protein [freshwater metagenome]|uniref:Unannotated protein n=1 Tax=freshwater metagenome TaxID=449393 RepID=A0A6J6F232_9ZZZZ
MDALPGTCAAEIDRGVPGGTGTVATTVAPGPGPTAFSATTVNVIDVPGASDTNVHDDAVAGALHDAPPGSVTV